MYLDFYKNSFFSYFFIYIIKVLLVFERSQSERIQTTTIYIYNSYVYHLLGVHLFLFFFLVRFLYVSIVYAFFFFRSCNMTFLSIKDFVLFLSGFCMSPIVLLSYQSIVICYNKSRNNQTLASFQFQWHMSALRLVTLQKN